jgi:predicted membrane channel-forming protein YqfA (hemolysin III family)
VKSPRQHWLPSPFVAPPLAGNEAETLFDIVLKGLLIILSIVEVLASILINGLLMVLSIVFSAAAAFFLLVLLPSMAFGADVGSLSPLLFGSLGLISILAGAALYLWRPWAPYVPFFYVWACPKCGAMVNERALKCPTCEARFEHGDEN